MCKRSLWITHSHLRVWTLTGIWLTALSGCGVGLEDPESAMSEEQGLASVPLVDTGSSPVIAAAIDLTPTAEPAVTIPAMVGGNTDGSTAGTVTVPDLAMAIAEATATPMQPASGNSNLASESQEPDTSQPENPDGDESESTDISLSEVITDTGSGPIAPEDPNPGDSNGGGSDEPSDPDHDPAVDCE